MSSGTAPPYSGNGRAGSPRTSRGEASGSPPPTTRRDQDPDYAQRREAFRGPAALRGGRTFAARLGLSLRRTHALVAIGRTRCARCNRDLRLQVGGQGVIAIVEISVGVDELAIAENGAVGVVALNVAVPLLEVRLALHEDAG